MDLAAEDLEGLPPDECIAGPIRTRVSKVHAKQDDTQFLVHRGDPSGDRRVLHNILRLEVLATGSRTALARGNRAVLNAVGVRSEWRINGDEAANLESGR